MKRVQKKFKSTKCINREKYTGISKKYKNYQKKQKALKCKKYQK